MIPCPKCGATNWLGPTKTSLSETIGGGEVELYTCGCCFYQSTPPEPTVLEVPGEVTTPRGFRS